METKHREEILRFTHMIEKAYEWLPHLKELFRIERLCRLVGFSVEQTAKLMFGEPIEYSGIIRKNINEISKRRDHQCKSLHRRQQIKIDCC